MRKQIFLIFIFLLISSFAYAQQYQEIKSEHFILFYNHAAETGNPKDSFGNIIEAENFSKDVLRKAELYYERIAEDLGYQRTSGFWTWDNRVKVYLCPNHDEFVKFSNHPAWAGGAADYDTRTIMSYFGSKDFADTILPHEIAHLIFRDFVGFKGVIPLWLDEGVAQWTEETKRQKVKKLAQEMFLNNGLLTMNDMMKFPINDITNEESVYIRPTRTRTGEDGVLFLTGDNFIAAYYVEAVSLVGFLIEKFGKAEFTNFCRALRDGKNVEEALTTVYSTYIRSLADFEKQWRAYIENDT